MSRVFDMSFASVYPHYVTKVERKGRTVAELHEVIRWLTGFDDMELQRHLSAQTNFRDFFAAASLHPNAGLITGSICGIRVQDIEDPLMQKIRYLDKLVDELAKGRPLSKILRAESDLNESGPRTGVLIHLVAGTGAVGIAGINPALPPPKS